MATKGESGFSVAELLVATVMVFVLIGVIYNTFRVQILTTKSQESRVVAQEYSRTALDIMVREIRNAAYFPAAACAGGGVQVAQAQRIVFQLDANANGTCNLAGDNNESIEYIFDTTGCAAGFGNIRRKTLVPVTDEAMTDCNIPTGAANFSFTYFPQDCTNGFSTPVGGGSPACPGAPNAGTLAAIRRILISLTVQSAGPDREFGGGRLDAIMTSSVNLRNRGL